MKQPFSGANEATALFSNNNFEHIINSFKKLAFATKEGIWEYDIVQKTAFYNEGMEDLWGYSLKEMKDNNKWWRNNIHPQDKSRIINELDSLIESDKTVWWGKYLFRHKDGSYKLILDRLFIVRDLEGKVIRMIGTMQDLTPVNILQTKLNEIREKEKQNMLQMQIRASESERKSISEELHENINQVLAAINMHLAWLKEYIKPEGLSKISEVQEMLLSSISGVREISNTLSPVILDSLGLNMALEQLFASFFEATKINYHINIDKAAIAEKDTLILLTLYRVAQIQLKNISKHSSAENVLLTIKAADSTIRMTIYDDGNDVNFKDIIYGSGFAEIQNKVDAFGGSFSIQSIDGEKGFLLSVIL